MTHEKETNELECDVLADALRKLGYKVRGVAHPIDGTTINYDQAQSRGLDDRGGKRWGRPVINKEFVKSGGVEKLVISVHDRGQDKGVWKQPGKSGDGVDHILFRNPADVFYVTGESQRVGGIAWGTGMRTVIICPTKKAKDELGEPENGVVLESVWANSTEIEWFAANSSHHLLAPLRNEYAKLATGLRFHGILGFVDHGWSGSRQSKLWVEFNKTDGIEKGFLKSATSLLNQPEWEKEIMRNTMPNKIAAASLLTGPVGEASPWSQETFSNLSDQDAGEAWDVKLGFSEDALHDWELGASPKEPERKVDLDF